MSDEELEPSLPSSSEPGDEAQMGDEAVETRARASEMAAADAMTEAAPRRRSRLRRFFLRHLPLSLAGLVALGALLLVGLYYWASSPEFENLVRQRMVAELEASTGGRATIAGFHWRLLNLEAEATGLVLHGTEDVGDAPLLAVDRLSVRFSVLNLLSPRLLLSEATLVGPRIHLIAYADGSTNQPTPKHARKSSKSGLDTLFDLRVGRLTVRDGAMDLENRASDFDFENRFALVDMTARKLAVAMRWEAPGGGRGERYQIEASSDELSFGRGGSRAKEKENLAAGFRARLELMRAEARLEELSIVSQGRTVTVAGILQDFAKPRWQATARGEFDLKIVEPLTGYPDTSEGLGRVDMTAAGENGGFRVDGGLKIENGAYLGVGLNARFALLDTHVHLDPERMLLSPTSIRLRDGGVMEGSVDLSPWLPASTGGVTIGRPGKPSVIAAAPHDRNLLRAHRIPPDVPMVGKVTAQFKNVTLDALMDMVSPPRFRRLGLAALLNGPAEANWNHGDANTLAIGVKFALSPPAAPAAGEAPTTGAIEGTYTENNGSVDVRRLEAHTGATNISATGVLGVDPMTRPMQMNVSLSSQNLAELDAVLKDLELEREGKRGAAALPAALKGQASFDGAWTGSLVDPHLTGKVRASQISLEIPSLANDANAAPHWIYFDSAEAEGAYSAAKISIDRGQLRRGEVALDVEGSLEAAHPLAEAGVPEFDGSSLLKLHLQATRVPVSDVLDLAGSKAPVTGVLNAKLDTNGPAGTAPATGWVELDQGTVWGEPVARLRAQGSLSAEQVKITSMNLTEDAGKATASGSYEFSSGRFTLETHGAGIEAGRIRWLSAHGAEVSGKLAFAASGQGTMDDPRIEARATLENLALAGEPVGTLTMTARTAGQTATYDLRTQLDAAEMTAHGETRLKEDYPTTARLDFSRFNIGALLKLAHVKGLNGESAMAGSITVDGPMAHPDRLRGEARIAQVAATVSGVHLTSEGGLHATLRDGTVRLEPLHVTGEQTDLRAEGTIGLRGAQQLDFASSGSINLKIAETLDPDLTASGVSTFQVEAHGPLTNPELRGRVDFRDGALALEDLPNGLSQIKGTLEFNRNRLEVRSLTAMSGGGLLSVGGFLSYQKGLYADLSVTGKGIRIRYPQGVSSQADASLRLQGPQSNFLLSGDVQITRFMLSPDLDMTALAAGATGVQPIAAPDAPSNHFRLDVHVTSSPQLNFQNAYAKLAGNVDLRLRGTIASPSLLGRVSVTEGSAILAGTRYELQRGEISFNNPVRIQPNIDLNATARVEDYDITLGLHGTPDKMTAAYRSDPPLPEADVLALLALGRTENQQRIYGQQQEQAGSNPATDALLGGALNATVSSRVQRLFGAGAVKVDPSYLGALGNSTSRITVEEQLGSNVTLTYATNVNTTAQQLLQAEVAINRHVSVQLTRDESGVFSVVLKATRRFR